MRCDHVDDQVATESPGTGGRGERWSVSEWCGPARLLTPSLCHKTQAPGIEWAEHRCHWDLGPTFPRPNVHLKEGGTFLLSASWILPVEIWCTLADDMRWYHRIISRLLTTLARAEHHSIQFQFPGRGKFQGDTLNLSAQARQGAPHWIWITVSFSSQVWQSPIGYTPQPQSSLWKLKS